MKTKRLFAIGALCALLACPLAAQEEIKLYPDGPRESNGLTRPENHSNRDDGWLTDVSEARLYAYIAPREKADGTALIICPGGSYAGLAARKEGEEFARWLNERGVSAFVLYYRMPNGHHTIPLTDAQTAIRLVRRNAREWHIDRHRIGIAGFSAGGHLASTAGTHFTGRHDRPDFMVLLYPVITMKADTHAGSRDNLLGSRPTEELLTLYSNELQVTKDTPPAFIVHAKDDRVVPMANSRLFYDALRARDIDAELHVYEHGGHGFGLRRTGHDSQAWPSELEHWLEHIL